MVKFYPNYINSKAFIVLKYKGRNNKTFKFKRGLIFITFLRI